MTEEEDILADLKDRMDTVPDAEYVSDDVRQLANPPEVPAIFFVDFGDNVKDAKSRPTPIYMRIMHLGLVAIIDGSTQEDAPAELRAFIKEMKKKLYKDGKRSIGTTYKGAIYETGKSRMTFPKTGNNRVAKAIEIDIQYNEDTQRLFT